MGSALDILEHKVLESHPNQAVHHTWIYTSGRLNIEIKIKSLPHREDMP